MRAPQSIHRDNPMCDDERSNRTERSVPCLFICSINISADVDTEGESKCPIGNRMPAGLERAVNISLRLNIIR
jgi:hypothetical protein